MRDAHPPRDRLEGLMDGAGGVVLRRAIGVAGIVIGGFQAGTRQDGMELVEQDLLPRLAQLPRMAEPADTAVDAAPLLRRQEAVFRLADPLLDARVRRLA